MFMSIVNKMWLYWSKSTTDSRASTLPISTSILLQTNLRTVLAAGLNLVFKSVGILMLLVPRNNGTSVRIAEDGSPENLYQSIQRIDSSSMSFYDALPLVIVKVYCAHCNKRIKPFDDGAYVEISNYAYHLSGECFEQFKKVYTKSFEKAVKRRLETLGELDENELP